MPSETAKSISVLTLNTWNRSGPYPERRSLIRTALQRLQPDLLALQEVVGKEHADELLSELGYHCEWLGIEQGVAIAARWPIEQREELWLPGDGEPQGGGPALRGLVQSPYGVIPFTTTHTFYYATHHGFKRERLMPTLNDFARTKDKDHLPAILAGDFNADPESAEIRYLKGLQSLAGRSAYWCDAWEQGGDGGKGITWSRDNQFAAWVPWPSRRIDYIFVAQPRMDGAGTITECNVVMNVQVGGIWPSDHFGVLARLQLP